MLKHIVCFKLTDDSEESRKKAKEVLLSMRENIPVLRSVEAGYDIGRTARSYDVILEITVDDEKALAEYLKHPYHTGVIQKYMHSVRSASVAIDYIIDAE